MAESLRDEGVAVRWVNASDDLFFALKRVFAPGDSWTFSIAAPDAVPCDVDPTDLRDIRGAAAFMLRRIQAIRYLLTVDNRDQARLLVGYAADLCAFLEGLIAAGSVSNPLEENYVLVGAEATKDLLAFMVNVLMAPENG